MTQAQTNKSFGDKWKNNPSLAMELTSSEHSEVFKWIINRNGFATKQDFQNFLQGKKRVLDAGCGNGRVTKLLRMLCAPDTEVVGADFSSWEVAAENLREEQNLSVHYADLRGDLSHLGTFDFIYCQEVLHHTGDAAAAFANLCRILRPGGEIAIYVYKQKAPVREFTDDYIRDRIKDLSYEESMALCSQITDLGKTLTDLNAEFDCPEVKLLDIPAGRYTMQRFLYHFFMKCFWNPELSHADNTVINYDWYHPQDCTRHTPEEVRAWFEANGLNVVQDCTDFYGITMRGILQTK